MTALMRERVLGSFTIFIPQRIGKADVFRNVKLKPKMSLEDGITGMAQIPKAASQRGYASWRPGGNTLGQSKEKGGKTDNRQMRPTLGADTKKKILFLLISKWADGKFVQRHTRGAARESNPQMFQSEPKLMLFYFSTWCFLYFSPGWPEQL